MSHFQDSGFSLWPLIEDPERIDLGGHEEVSAGRGPGDPKALDPDLVTDGEGSFDVANVYYLYWMEDLRRSQQTGFNLFGS